MRERTPTRSDVGRYKPMSAAEFRSLGEIGAIKSIEVLRVDRGVYWVLVYVTGKRAPQLLYTTRDRPRAWLSLDRLIGHLETTWPAFDGFTVVYKLAEDRSAEG